MSEELESLHVTLLKTQAICFALESLCLALFQVSTDKDAIIDRYQYQKLDLEDSLLHSTDTPDVVFREFENAHANIAARLHTLRSLT